MLNNKILSKIQECTLDQLDNTVFHLLKKSERYKPIEAGIDALDDFLRKSPKDITFQLVTEQKEVFTSIMGKTDADDAEKELSQKVLALLKECTDPILQAYYISLSGEVFDLRELIPAHNNREPLGKETNSAKWLLHPETKKAFSKEDAERFRVAATEEDVRIQGIFLNGKNWRDVFSDLLSNADYSKESFIEWLDEKVSLNEVASYLKLLVGKKPFIPEEEGPATSVTIIDIIEGFSDQVREKIKKHPIERQFILAASFELPSIFQYFLSVFSGFLARSHEDYLQNHLLEEWFYILIVYLQKNTDSLDALFEKMSACPDQVKFRALQIALSMLGDEELEKQAGRRLDFGLVLKSTWIVYYDKIKNSISPSMRIDGDLCREKYEVELEKLKCLNDFFKLINEVKQLCDPELNWFSQQPAVNLAKIEDDPVLEKLRAQSNLKPLAHYCSKEEFLLILEFVLSKKTEIEENFNSGKKTCSYHFDPERKPLSRSVDLILEKDQGKWRIKLAGQLKKRVAGAKEKEEMKVLSGSEIMIRGRTFLLGRDVNGEIDICYGVTGIPKKNNWRSKSRLLEGARKSRQMEEATSFVMGQSVVEDYRRKGSTEDTIKLISPLAMASAFDVVRAIWSENEASLMSDWSKSSEAKYLLRKLAYEAIRAMLALHANHWVHRDIKLENLLVVFDKKLHCRWCDSSTAAHRDSGQLANLVGTLSVAAPEQVAHFLAGVEDISASMLVFRGKSFANLYCEALPIEYKKAAWSTLKNIRTKALPDISFDSAVASDVFAMGVLLSRLRCTSRDAQTGSLKIFLDGALAARVEDRFSSEETLTCWIFHVLIEIENSANEKEMAFWSDALKENTEMFDTVFTQNSTLFHALLHELLQAKEINKTALDYTKVFLSNLKGRLPDNLFEQWKKRMAPVNSSAGQGDNTNAVASLIERMSMGETVVGSTRESEEVGVLQKAI